MKWSVELFRLNKMSGLKSYREKFYDYLFDTKDNDKEENQNVQETNDSKNSNNYVINKKDSCESFRI